MVKSTKSTSEKNKQQIRTENNQNTFLSYFAQSGHVGRSAEAAGIERTTVYLWRRNPEFEKRFLAAEKESVGVLEDEMHRRGVQGVDKPVFYKGEPCGVVREYSDTLLIVLAKARAPEKYRERHELTGADGGPVLIKEVEVRLTNT